MITKETQNSSCKGKRYAKRYRVKITHHKKNREVRSEIIRKLSIKNLLIGIEVLRKNEGDAVLNFKTVTESK